MENTDVEFRTVLVKVADRISTNELRTLRFIFSDRIPRDDHDTVAVNFFQQLLDRNIIDQQNLSTLIHALENIACRTAAQLLKDYQEPSSIRTSLWKDICDDEQFDKQSMHEFVPGIDREPVSQDHQSISLCNNQENAMSTLTTFGKPKRTTRTIISVTLSIGFLLYTIIWVGISYYWMPKTSDETKAFSRAKLCRPSALERYFIKSRHSGKLIGITNTVNNQGDRLYEWNDTQNQLCLNQWHFVPVTNSEKDQTYIIQSVYNRKVFDVSPGHVSNHNQVLHWDMAMNDTHQQFHLIADPNEDSCFIQSLATKNILDAKTNEFITQTDVEISKNESTTDRHRLLWQLIPFDINRPGEKWTDCPYVSSINDLTVIKFGKVFGTDNSYSTDDSKHSQLTTSHFISVISLTSSERLDSIRFTYSSSNRLSAQSSESGILRGQPATLHNAYRKNTFNVTQKSINERIDRVSLVVNVGKDDPKASTLHIVGIQFHTTFNRTSPFYGSQQGQRYTEEYPGFALGYVRGGTSMYIEKLQFIWYKL